MGRGGYPRERHSPCSNECLGRLDVELYLRAAEAASGVKVKIV